MGAKLGKPPWNDNEAPSEDDGSNPTLPTSDVTLKEPTKDSTQLQTKAQQIQTRSGEQQTLHTLYRRANDTFGSIEGRNGISTLGSFHQAIGRPFSSTRRRKENGLKVAQSHEMLTAILQQPLCENADQQTLRAWASMNLDSFEGSKYNNGILALRTPCHDQKISKTTIGRHQKEQRKVAWSEGVSDQLHSSKLWCF